MTPDAVLCEIETGYRNTTDVDENDLMDTKKHIMDRYGMLQKLYPDMPVLTALKAICIFRDCYTPFTDYIIQYEGSEI